MLRIPSSQPSPGGERSDGGGQSYNPDHARYIIARQRARQEEAGIADLERRAAPLHWALIVALLALAAASAVDQVNTYHDLVAQQEAIVQCLNGRTVGIGDAVMTCQVRELVMLDGGIK